MSDIIERFKQAIDRSYSKGLVSDAGLAKAQLIRVISPSEKSEIEKSKPKAPLKPKKNP
jgi:hypothetical protein